LQIENSKFPHPPVLDFGLQIEDFGFPHRPGRTRLRISDCGFPDPVEGSKSHEHVVGYNVPGGRDFRIPNSEFGTAHPITPAAGLLES